MRLWCGLVVSWTLASCQGCDRPAPSDPPPVHVGSMEDWRFSVGDDTLPALPAPCHRRSSLVALPPRRAHLFAAAEMRAGEVVAVEGTDRPSRGRPVWSPEGAGWMTLRPDGGSLAPPVALSWRRGAKLVAGRARPSPMVLLDPRTLWTAASRHRLPIDTASIGCLEDRCVALSPGSARRPANAALWQAPRPLSSWVPLDLPFSARTAVAVAPEPEVDAITVIVADDLRVRFARLDRQFEWTAQSSLEAPQGFLAALAKPRSALTPIGLPATACAPEDGGARLVRGNGAPVDLGSPFAADAGQLLRLEGARLFATWSAPERCRSSDRRLYAVVVDEGGVLGPVADLGPVSSWATTHTGRDLSVWIVRPGRGRRDEVLWLRGDC